MVRGPVIQLGGYIGFLGNCYCDRSHSGCWYYSVLDSRNPALVIKLNINDFINIDECFSVKSFGEFEYWFSFIKVISIVLFLCLGLAVILGFVPGTEAPGTSNLVGQGGFMPNGISSVLLGITVVIFSFMGSEIVAVAAGESAEPVKAVKTATNSVIWRILVFSLDLSL